MPRETIDRACPALAQSRSVHNRTRHTFVPDMAQPDRPHATPVPDMGHSSKADTLRMRIGGLTKKRASSLRILRFSVTLLGPATGVSIACSTCWLECEQFKLVGCWVRDKSTRPSKSTIAKEREEDLKPVPDAERPSMSCPNSASR
eukprot:2818585-Rhodomonas_salina.3